MADKNDPHISSVALDPGVTGRVVTLTEYGMKYPDGSIDWTTTRCNISIQTSIVERKGYDYWTDRMHSRAKAANMSVEDYANAHTILERTVIVSITDAKEYTK